MDPGDEIFRTVSTVKRRVLISSSPHCFQMPRRFGQILTEHGHIRVLEPCQRALLEALRDQEAYRNFIGERFLMSDTFATTPSFIEDREQPEKKKRRPGVAWWWLLVFLWMAALVYVPIWYASLYDKKPAPVAAAPVPALIVAEPAPVWRQRRSKRRSKRP